MDMGRDRIQRLDSENACKRACLDSFPLLRSAPCGPRLEGAGWAHTTESCQRPSSETSLTPAPVSTSRASCL